MWRGKLFQCAGHENEKERHDLVRMTDGMSWDAQAYKLIDLLIKSTCSRVIVYEYSNSTVVAENLFMRTSKSANAAV